MAQYLEFSPGTLLFSFTHRYEDSSDRRFAQICDPILMPWKEGCLTQRFKFIQCDVLKFEPLIPVKISPSSPILTLIWRSEGAWCKDHGYFDVI
jgi:hypothetical protein